MSGATSPRTYKAADLGESGTKRRKVAPDFRPPGQVSPGGQKLTRTRRASLT
eukprot:CAMPEP_0183435518 /NCGR_PEP_ID=MMETSP0370-20130417/68655_1 /TAXON_ID=268820 /ORGANISM="Peridinium aciculiferum, Strain PAER-2" /LENGTH=51 /DNA_ID=CAMNT_0025622663 /DNA_START=24 /DNA_END=175 /DNA_ORIENTATION=+